MKRIFLVAGIMTAATATFAQASIVHATHKEAKMENREAKKESRAERQAENMNDVSVLTKDHFAADFPDAKNVLFEKTTNFDEASFIEGTDKLRAYYDYSSTLIGTTQRKTFADLPENAQKRIQKEYPGYDATVVIKFDDNETNDMDMILYGMSFNDADNYFVELTKDNKAIVVKVDMEGQVSYFKAIK